MSSRGSSFVPRFHLIGCVKYLVAALAKAHQSGTDRARARARALAGNVFFWRESSTAVNVDLALSQTSSVSERYKVYFFIHRNISCYKNELVSVC